MPATSLGRAEITELTHIAPIKKGLVPGHQHVTYADRLRIILQAFNAREEQRFPNVIRTFRGIHFSQWALLDGDTRLMLNVVFDGDWYDYLRALVDDVPWFLNLIWSNCEGWERVANKPEELFRFIKAYQVQVSFLYAQHPHLTVKDIDWLEALRRELLANAGTSIDTAALLARVEAALAPRPLHEVRADLLHAFDVGKPALVDRLGKAKQAFREVIGAMYDKDEYEGAFRESFASEV